MKIATGEAITGEDLMHKSQMYIQYMNSVFVILKYHMGD